jgi:uncharacterized protein with von Willebrand factor type A (vWA) domain
MPPADTPTPPTSPGGSTRSGWGGDRDDTAVGAGILERLTALSTAMRRAGIPTTQSETLDAVHALAAVDLADRRQVREALAAVSLTSGAQRPTFDALFDLFLPARVGSGVLGGPDGGQDGGQDDADGPDAGRSAGRSTSDAEAFIDDLLRGLLEGDDADVRRLAREAVDRFGQLPVTATGTPGERGWFRYRVLRAIDPASLIERMLARSSEDPAALSALRLRLARDEAEARVRMLVQEIDAEVRRRAAADRDPQAIARSAVRGALQDLDLLHLTRDQQAELQRSIRPLARRLASRAAVRRRRGHDGRLDVRRTVRHALSTGGVPFEPSFRPRRPHRPELFLLCDVSGSVATFARFTLMLVHAMQTEFSGVRSFAFVDALDEVSHLFGRDDMEVAVGRLMTEARIIRADGHSDYGRALESFIERHGHDVTARSTVVVLGDARTNYRHPGTEALERIQRRARRVWWLNPEPRSAWDTGDSVAASYARYVEEMVEVRNLRQLAALVERVA